MQHKKGLGNMRNIESKEQRAKSKVEQADKLSPLPFAPSPDFTTEGSKI